MIHRFAIFATPAFLVAPSTASAQVYFSYQGHHHYGFGGGYRYAAPVYGYGYYYVPQPLVIVVPREREPVPIHEPFPTVDDYAPARVEAAVKRGDFLVVKPGQKVAPPPIPLPKPPVEPKALAAFLVKQARDSFEQEQIGRAGERFRAAIELQPKDAQLQFWLAQVHVARGEYPEALTAFRAGLALDPEWPTAPFNLKELYGARAAALAGDIAELKALQSANPGDFGLAFVAGVYEWFSGNRQAAVKLFEKAKRGYPVESQTFLNAAKR